MTGSVALDVVIGLVFIFLLYSLLASIIQEIIATNLSFRAKILEKAIARMLQDPEAGDRAFKDKFRTWRRLLTPFDSFEFLKNGGLAKAFYDHPLIQGLGEDKWHSKPSYLSSENFSKVIVDLLRGENIKVGEDIRSYIEKTLGLTLSNKPGNKQNKGVKTLLFNIGEKTKRRILSLWTDAQGDIEEFKSHLETWFDDTMARTSGWYKKYNQTVLFVIGLGIAVIFNVDSVAIAKKLSSDPEIRTQLVSQANNFIATHPNLEEELNVQKAALASIEADSTMKKNTEKKYQALIKHRDSLMNQANSLIQNDLKNTSNLLALGWKKGDATSTNEPWTKHIWGWILTAMAISMGAPFWFDLLNKLMKLRASVQTKSTSSASGKTEGKTKVKRVG